MVRCTELITSCAVIYVCPVIIELTKVTAELLAMLSKLAGLQENLL